MSESKFNPEDMPILDINTSGLDVFELSRHLDSPQAISAFLAEVIKAGDPQLLMRALADVAKAQGINKVAQAAGVNRESLYKTLKGGEKTRFETVTKLLKALGVELTVQPIAVDMPAPAPTPVNSEGPR
ncbi:MAG: addiction module antidote protein [Pseudomonas sp.]|uniref:addiction module antidote protein n=1 Tax=Pseudomonas sp. TaxID=306 RepID=UPI0030F34490